MEALRIFVADVADPDNSLDEFHQLTHQVEELSTAAEWWQWFRLDKMLRHDLRLIENIKFRGSSARLALSVN